MSARRIIGAADQLTHLFERHWQGRAGGRRGAGMGLAIVREIAGAHGGRAWVERLPGRETTFFVSIPLRAEPADVGTSAAGPTVAPDGGPFAEPDPRAASVVPARDPGPRTT